MESWLFSLSVGSFPSGSVLLQDKERWYKNVCRPYKTLVHTPLTSAIVATVTKVTVVTKL